MDFSTILKRMVATVQKSDPYKVVFLIYKNNQYLGLKQNNLNYVSLVNQKGFCIA